MGGPPASERDHTMMTDADLYQLAIRDLATLAIRATALTRLRLADQPCERLALLAGVRKEEWPTPRDGIVASYSGEGTIEMSGGRRFRAIGHPASGDAYTPRQGWIEYAPA